MSVYSYKAVDSKGKVIKGNLQAQTDAEASAQISQLGYFPISINKGKKNIRLKGKKKLSIGKYLIRKRVQRASSKSIIIFIRQFSTIVKAAVPILEGLKVLSAQSEDKNLKQALSQVVKDIEGGSKLSEAMSQHPGIFTPLVVNTIMAGEVGGILDKVLLELADVLEEEQEIKAGVSGALRYPLIVVVILIIALYILSVYVLPNVVNIYAGKVVELPLPTQIMMFVGNAFSKYWFLTMISVAVIFGGIKSLLNTPAGKWWYCDLQFKLPVFGKIYNKIIMLRFNSLFKLLYESGLPILRTLDIVKNTIGNVVLMKEIDTVKEEVSAGKGISSYILKSPLFPQLVGYMISIGEKTGSLPNMLGAVCDYYTREVRVQLKNLTTLIEPIMTVVLAGVVVVMALAILMPMWNMISVMKSGM